MEIKIPLKHVLNAVLSHASQQGSPASSPWVATGTQWSIGIVPLLQVWEPPTLEANKDLSEVTFGNEVAIARIS